MPTEYNRPKRKGEEEPAPKTEQNQSAPRVRAFVRSYAPIVNHDDPDAILFNLQQLRQMFSAYMPQAATRDPLDWVLNQLDQEGFELTADWYKDELVLAVKRVMIFDGRQMKGLPEPDKN